MALMRLTPQHIETIKGTAAQFWGADAGVVVFGSRLHDEQRGGDLDLYIETPQPDLLQTIRCKVMLQDALYMPVDLVVKPIGDQSPISKIAKAEGVRL